MDSVCCEIGHDGPYQKANLCVHWFVCIHTLEPRQTGFTCIRTGFGIFSKFYSNGWRCDWNVLITKIIRCFMS